MLAQSLQTEPGIRAAIPDDTQRLRFMEPLIRGMIDISRRHGSCSVALRQETVVGVGVWLPPGAYPPGLLDNLRMIPAMRGALALSREQHGILRTMAAVAEKHFPPEPVWYLQALGVAPGLQGLGIGSRLLRYHLNRTDHEGVPCYLEASGDANIRFYERAGFVARDSSLHFVPGVEHRGMVRPVTT